MPTLDWIGKAAVKNHHRQVPYRLLHCDNALSAGDKDTGNLLVQGDNLEALKALLPYYAGRVKCIYIDPPFNTGNDWDYNDRVDSPIIREWLQKTVGPEAEDLSRHDKWLCMMYPRLCLLKDLMRRDAFIFLHLDHNEVGCAAALMDEIFGANNRLHIIGLKTRDPSGFGATGDKLFRTANYILMYRRSVDAKLVKQYEAKGYDTGYNRVLKNPQDPIDDWTWEAGLVLWLAPTTKIVDQTMAALRDRKHPYREALDARFRNVQVLDLDAALYLQRASLETDVTIIVTTMAALRSEETERRRVFRDNGQLKHHFDSLTDEQRQALLDQAEDGDDPTFPSLQNVIRMNKPVVIVDEAHGFRTDLSFETLRRFNPGCVLELTATPHDDSNVLHSVTAAELKADEMVKLPVLLRTRKIARDAVAQAVEKRKELEDLATAQEQAGGPYVRPVVLYQAESRGRDLTPEALRKMLTEDFGIEKEHVAVCVGGQDELADRRPQGRGGHG